MAALWNGSKCSHTTCMLRFFTDPRLALNSNLIFETGSCNFRKRFPLNPMVQGDNKNQVRIFDSLII